MKQNKLIYKKFIEKVESLTKPCRKKKIENTANTSRCPITPCNISPLDSYVLSVCSSAIKSMHNSFRLSDSIVEHLKHVG